ncbi:MAG: DUF4235 domain-containing protein [Dermatophilaceae bacterium]|nr:DUF4235 domain-containing protein [Intrasporangiaceae bacterium]
MDEKGVCVMGPLAWKVIGTGSAVLAGVIANKVVTEAWRRSGRDVEIDPNNPDVPVGQAIAFAAAMGLAMGIARVFATRQAASYYRKASGHLPNDLQPKPQD